MAGMDDAQRSAPSRGTPSRRGFLSAAALGVAAAGGGVAVGFASTGSPDHPVAGQSNVLFAAAASERALIASIDALRARPAPSPAILRQLRADHVAHLQALEAAQGVRNGSTPPPPRVSAPSRARLRALEQQASTRAATRALRLNGRDAVLLASISACEATHAELLT